MFLKGEFVHSKAEETDTYTRPSQRVDGTANPPVEHLHVLHTPRLVPPRPLAHLWVGRRGRRRSGWSGGSAMVHTPTELDETPAHRHRLSQRGMPRDHGPIDHAEARKSSKEPRSTGGKRAVSSTARATRVIQAPMLDAQVDASRLPPGPQCVFHWQSVPSTGRRRAFRQPSVVPPLCGRCLLLVVRAFCLYFVPSACSPSLLPLGGRRSIRPQSVALAPSIPPSPLHM